MLHSGKIFSARTTRGGKRNKKNQILLLGRKPTYSTAINDYHSWYLADLFGPPASLEARASSEGDRDVLLARLLKCGRADLPTSRDPELLPRSLLGPANLILALNTSPTANMTRAQQTISIALLFTSVSSLSHPILVEHASNSRSFTWQFSWR